LSNFGSLCLPEKRYQPFLQGGSTLNNRYFVLKLRNVRWRFQQSTKIRMVRLIVLTGSSGLSNSVIRCILYLLEHWLNQHICCERILHLIQSIVYGLYIIMWIEIPTGLCIYLTFQDQGVQEEDC
jgi:hypothetical protein